MLQSLQLMYYYSSSGKSVQFLNSFNVSCVLIGPECADCLYNSLLLISTFTVVCIDVDMF